MSIKQPIVYAKYYVHHLGWSILPLHWIANGKCTCGRPDCGGSAGKHPLGEWRQHQDQPMTLEQVDEAWTTQPYANIGLVTGAKSGVVVLDIDPRHGGDIGLETLEHQYGKLPHTLESLTGGGGRHLIFKHPGTPVKNKVNLAPGVDVRGDGGLIVLPYSVHASGQRYEWELSSLPNQVKPAPMPEWLLKLLTTPQAQAPNGTKEDTDWAKIILHGAKEGERNNTAARLAGRLVRKGLSAPEAAAFLLVWNKLNNPPLPDDEILRTVESVAKLEVNRRQRTVSK